MGESCGTALWAALQLARDVDDPDALFVVLLPDSGRNYVGKLYNDAWLREQGPARADEEAADYDWRPDAPDIVLRGDEIPRRRLSGSGRAVAIRRLPAGALRMRLVAVRRSRRGRESRDPRDCVASTPADIDRVAAQRAGRRMAFMRSTIRSGHARGPDRGGSCG